MVTVNWKEGNDDKNVDIPWIERGEIENLLGNARPDTLAKILNDNYWLTIFDRWSLAKNDAISVAYQAWKDAPNKDGAERDTLKAANGESRFPNMSYTNTTRELFYEDLKYVKAVRRAEDLTTGEAADRNVDIVNPFL